MRTHQHELGLQHLQRIHAFKHLARTMHKLEDFLEVEAAGGAPRTEAPQTLRKLLAELGTELPPHFADEEGPGGFFETLEPKFPQLTPRLESLKAEHPKILAGLRRAARLAETDWTAEPIPAETVAATRLLVARLRRHEAEENELLQQAYCGGDGVTAD